MSLIHHSDTSFFTPPESIRRTVHQSGPESLESAITGPGTRRYPHGYLGSYGREVFFRRRAAEVTVPRTRRSLAASTRIADIVAASGAFPGAFQPKVLQWFKTGDQEVEVEERKFIDGGVIDNLGLEGLHRYLLLRNGAPQEKPELLILSNAGLPTEPNSYRAKLGFMALVERASDLSFDAMQKFYLSLYTGHRDYLDWIRKTPLTQQVGCIDYSAVEQSFGGDDPKKFCTVAIPITAAQINDVLGHDYNGCSLDGESLAEVQRDVASYETLQELEPKQVQKAFWLGYTLAQVYWPTIACARERALNSDAACGSPSAFTCPDFKQLLAR